LGPDSAALLRTALFFNRVFKIFALFEFVYVINIKINPPLARLCNAEIGVQKDKRNQRVELVRGYYVSPKPLGLISTFTPH